VLYPVELPPRRSDIDQLSNAALPQIGRIVVHMELGGP